MAAVKKYRVISEGVLFGDQLISPGEFIPDNKARNVSCRNWLLGVGAVEEVVEDTAETTTNAAEEAANSAEEAMSGAQPPEGGN